jgi:hypothetical protein
MKGKKLEDPGPNFVEYDDENIEHVLAGPDYGQVDSGSKSTAWSEMESKEYDDFVEYLTDRIIRRKVKLFSKNSP